MKKSHGKSKRTSMKDKYKIQRKVEACKARRRAADESRGYGNAQVDPGIPTCSLQGTAA